MAAELKSRHVSRLADLEKKLCAIASTDHGRQALGSTLLLVT